MEAADSFFEGSKLAVAGLFDLLKRDRAAKTRTIVGLFSDAKPCAQKIAELKGRELSREFIAGAIFQMAYVSIERYAKSHGKSAGAEHFESEIRRLRAEAPARTRLKKDLVLPDTFCVGRDVGHLPLGVVIYAARNQFCHFADDRLTPLNELVFNASLEPTSIGPSILKWNGLAISSNSVK